MQSLDDQEDKLNTVAHNAIQNVAHNLKEIVQKTSATKSNNYPKNHPEAFGSQQKTSVSELATVSLENSNIVSNVPSGVAATKSHTAATKESDIKQTNPISELKSYSPMIHGPIRIPYCTLPAPHTHVAITEVLDARNIFLRPIDLQSHNEYVANVEAIGRYAENAKFLKETPLVGQLILAKNNEEFHRAMVLKNVSVDRFAVAFMEYGHVSCVSLADCKELAGDLQILKRYVHKFTLNISAEINDKHEDAIKLLKQSINVDMEILYNSPFTNGTVVNLCKITDGHSIKDQINSFVE